MRLAVCVGGYGGSVAVQRAMARRAPRPRSRPRVAAARFQLQPQVHPGLFHHAGKLLRFSNLLKLSLRYARLRNYFALLRENRCGNFACNASNFVSKSLYDVAAEIMEPTKRSC